MPLYAITIGRVASFIAGVSLALATSGALAGPTTVVSPSPPSPNQILPNLGPANKINLANVDLRPEINKRGLIPRAQGAGQCTLYAIGFLIEYMQKLPNSPGKPPYASIAYLDWAVSGGEKLGTVSGSGVFFFQVKAAYEKFGIVPESDFPVDIQAFANAAPNTPTIAAGKQLHKLKADVFRANDGTWGLSAEHLSSVKAYLNKGVPVAAGLRLVDTPTLQAYGTISALLDIAPNQQNFGHSVAIVGYQDAPLDKTGGGGYFIARNAGGPNWVNNSYKPVQGYFFISYAYFSKHVADLIVFNALEPGEQLSDAASSTPPAPPKTRLPDAPLAMIAVQKKK